MYDLKFFQTDLERNKHLIGEEIKRLKKRYEQELKEYHSELRKLKNIKHNLAQEYAEADYETRVAMNIDPYFLAVQNDELTPRRPKNESLVYRDALGSLYFLH